MWDTLLPWIIVIVVLVLSLMLYFVLGEKGSGIAEFFSRIWKFR